MSDGRVADADLRGFLANRLPSLENIERVRAAGMVADDPFVEGLAETLADIRVAVRGGRREPRGSRHWEVQE